MSKKRWQKTPPERYQPKAGNAAGDTAAKAKDTVDMLRDKAGNLTRGTAFYNIFH